MGVDAEMFVRIKGPRPSDQELRQIAHDMCEAIGREHFMIQTGEEGYS